MLFIYTISSLEIAKLFKFGRRQCSHERIMNTSAHIDNRQGGCKSVISSCRDESWVNVDDQRLTSTALDLTDQILSGNRR
jgi:hypothetical protein